MHLTHLRCIGNRTSNTDHQDQGTNDFAEKGHEAAVRPKEEKQTSTCVRINSLWLELLQLFLCYDKS